MMRQLVGLAIQFAISQRRTAADDGGGLRIRLRLLLHQLENAGCFAARRRSLQWLVFGQWRFGFHVNPFSPAKSARPGHASVGERTDAAECFSRVSSKRISDVPDSGRGN